MKPILTLLLSTLLWFSSCGAEDNDPLPSPQYLDFESVLSVDLSPGIRNSSIKLANGVEWNFQISVPENSNGAKLPLILALHWAGHELTYQEFMQCLVIPGFEELPAIIIAPTDDNELWWNPPMNAKLLELVRMAKAHWPVDDQRVAVMGYSNGGTGSWNFAINYPEEFSVAMPMAGFYQTHLEKIELPMYIIHGARDELFPWSTAKPRIDYAQSLGSEVTVDLVEDRSHFEACAYVPNLKDGVEWLKSNFWKD